MKISKADSHKISMVSNTSNYILSLIGIQGAFFSDETLLSDFLPFGSEPEMVDGRLCYRLIVYDNKISQSMFGKSTLELTKEERKKTKREEIVEVDTDDIYSLDEFVKIIKKDLDIDISHIKNDYFYKISLYVSKHLTPKNRAKILK